MPRPRKSALLLRPRAVQRRRRAFRDPAPVIESFRELPLDLLVRSVPTISTVKSTPGASTSSSMTAPPWVDAGRSSHLAARAPSISSVESHPAPTAASAASPEGVPSSLSQSSLPASHAMRPLNFHREVFGPPVRAGSCASSMPSACLSASCFQGMGSPASELRGSAVAVWNATVRCAVHTSPWRRASRAA